MPGLGEHLPRELLIALPDIETDLYRIHQLVWQHVARAVESQGRFARPEFIYRIDGGMIRVRGNLPKNKTSVSAFRANAPVHLDLAAVWGSEHENAVPEAHLADWCAEKIESAGFKVASLAVTNFQYRCGVKHATDNRQNIRIPVASVTTTVTAGDTLACALTWRQGIGRGKRFGLGMLAH
ncbi:hypothetical protein Rfer_4349 (plasmid) [Rhodoferax ferrireducens T118]|uniref:Type I-E CRISPR-associated protein Cas6/Cse3/CasE n=1 Tax=Albidiferax ferrireducens (strain ATCC BAA-621 / DSM 15236 / T118) TaxID=338969 RepID=Q21QB0_ALBFT|nr:hypothetical protein Rfer_4349 [Rhodoferax ferrireducens T118]